MMIPSNFISEQTASGSDVFEVVSRLEPILIGIPRGLGLISLLSMAIHLQNPDLTPDQLKEGVKGVSEYLCLWLESLEGEQVLN